MAAKAKTPTGKIIIAVIIALLSLAVIWLIIDNPFSNNSNDKNVTYFYDKPDIDSNQDKVTEDNNASSEFADFNPEPDPGQFEDDSYDNGLNEDMSPSTTNEENSYQQIDNTVVIEDQSPPAEPTIVSFPANKTFNRSPSFSFQGEKGATFKCSLNKSGYQNASQCSVSKKYKNLKYSKKYTFRVWQVDVFGQRSYYPAVKQFYLRNPNPPRRPVITSSPKRYTNASTYKFTFRGVTNKFKCSLNQPLFKKSVNCVSPTSTNNLPDGRYVFRVWQIRDRIKSKSPAQYIFNVDRTAPDSPTITLSPAPETSEPAQIFEFAGEEGAKFSCSIDDIDLTSCSSPYSTNLGPGSYTFRVYQTDQAGNRSLAPAETSFTVLEPETLSVTTTPKRGLRGYESDAAPIDGTYTAENQTTSEETTFTVNVLAAIELSDPSDDSDSVAPVAGGASNAIADLDISASLRSNLSWQVNSSVAGDLTGGSTGSRDLLNSLVGQGSGVDSGSRNSDNSAQLVEADYDQAVSWGDEAGAYTEVITHTATQTLGN